jgi:lipoprotein-anchoring transpeptidase ErfK/SrfK
VTARKEPVDTLLALGIRAAQGGRHREARDYLAAVLDLEPTNIPALMWQAWLARHPADSLSYLARVMEIDPRNKQARAGIRWARKRLAEYEAAPQEAEPSSRFDTVASEKVQDRVRKAVRAQRARRMLGPFSILVLALASMIAVFALGGEFFYPVNSRAARLPTQSPTTSVAPTSTPTPPPTCTPPPTATPSPAITPTPTGTLIVNGRILPYLPQSPAEKWIEVDLAAQRLIAYEGTTPVLDRLVSTGLGNTPTRQGQFRIYHKLLSTTMTGPGYNLPNVPYTMYFYKSYGLHGTYWHDNFGQPMSHGCINLKTEDAKWLFEWAEPALLQGQRAVKATEDNPGTLVVVHY